jgi:hypothetical protein
MGTQNAERTSPLSHRLDSIHISTMTWPRYRLGTMTNDLESAKELLHAEDYKMLNVLRVLWSVPKGLWRLHTTFGGFGLFSLPAEQLIS